MYKIKTVLNKNYYLQRFYDKLKTVLHIVPFYLVAEGLYHRKPDEIGTKLDLFHIQARILTPNELKLISNHPEVAKEEAFRKNKNASEWICMGVFYRQDIVSYMWCNIKRCDDRLLSFELGDNEAYLTWAYTFKAYRGKNIAPFLRFHFYNYLNSIGRDKIYSITEYLNEPAVRFKQKLNARKLKLYLYICIVKKLKIRMLLKNFSK